MASKPLPPDKQKLAAEEAAELEDKLTPAKPDLEDDEVLVLIIVIELQLVFPLVFFVALLAFKVRLGELVLELGRLLRGGILFVGRERLGRHETNRC